MSADLISNERAYIGSKSINSIVRKAIVKEGGRNARILYAGANPNYPGTMVVCKVVELFKGRYYYEETVFNPFVRSIHSTLTSVTEKFHKIIDPLDKLHEMKFHPNPQIVAGTSYSRELQGGKVFHDSLIKDYRIGQGYLDMFINPFYYWRIRNYLNKKC